jgi:phage terminase large subunit-like protein
VLVEDSASGQSAIQELKRTTALPVVAVKPKGSKIARAEAVAPLFESGRVPLPRASDDLARGAD